MKKIGLVLVGVVLGVMGGAYLLATYVSKKVYG